MKDWEVIRNYLIKDGDKHINYKIHTLNNAIKSKVEKLLLEYLLEGEVVYEKKYTDNIKDPKKLKNYDNYYRIDLIRNVTEVLCHETGEFKSILNFIKEPLKAEQITEKTVNKIINRYKESFNKITEMSYVYTKNICDKYSHKPLKDIYEKITNIDVKDFVDYCSKKEI